MNTYKQICTFKVDSHEFGVTAVQIQEIIRPQRITRVPRATTSILGLINLRGQLVTAIDMRKVLDFSQPDELSSIKNMNVVVHSSQGLLSLVVDHIGEVVEVYDQQFENLPQTLTGKIKDCLQGVYKLKERLILLLDIDKICNKA